MTNLTPEILACESAIEVSPISHAVESVAAACLLAACAPVIAASALGIAALSRRSPFVAHLRVGRFGTPLWVLKLRTMWPARDSHRYERGWVEWIVADPEVGSKNPRDQRIGSRFASFCRKHSIDELPQLWHVVRGEMSLVGPRPLTRSELDRHYGRRSEEILSVKPGLTGLWQTEGRSTLAWPRRVTLDVQMTRGRTLRKYVGVLLKTIPAIITGNGAW